MKYLPLLFLWVLIVSCAPPPRLSSKPFDLESPHLAYKGSYPKYKIPYDLDKQLQFSKDSPKTQEKDSLEISNFFKPPDLDEHPSDLIKEREIAQRDPEEFKEQIKRLDKLLEKQKRTRR